MGFKYRIPAAYVLGLFAAWILAVAAFAKAGDPGLFVDQITAHGVTPPSWSPVIAYFFIAVELLAAAGFLAFIWPRLVLCGTILMMLVFIVVTALAWSMGNTESCGCFGRLVERGPEAVIIEDTVVILASALALWLLRSAPRERSLGRWLVGGVHVRAWRWVIAVPLILVAGGLTAFGRALPIDRLVVGIGPGDDLSNMALSGMRFSLDDGWALVALVGPDCPACDAGVPALKEATARAADLKIVAVHPGGAAEAQAWRMRHLPSFPVAYQTPRVLRQYYRALPTTFLLHDGLLQHVWWGRIPAADELLAVLPTAAVPASAPEHLPSAAHVPVPASVPEPAPSPAGR
jgi:uncharacterized membrane protein YphA (DoxX/SURF4 family)/thiol-disulfide isomerase/thioredoxin